MALYAVHCASGAHVDVSNARFIKQGFRIFAFVFAPFWLLAHRLWSPFALWLVATVMIGALIDALVLTQGAAAALNFLLALFVGFQGAEWLNDRANREGAPESEIVAARNLAEAERTYFSRAAMRPVISPQASSGPSPAPPRSQTGGVIGLFPEAGR